jgi:hypothetical protein
VGCLLFAVAERIVCLISRFTCKTDSARFNSKKQGLTFISFHARHLLLNLLNVLRIAPTKSEDGLSI